METIELNDGTLDSFDIDNIEIENLLFQTGYLTIKSFKNDGFERYYEMSYPNYEVKVSLNRWILRYLSNIGVSEETKLIKQIREAISKENVEKLRETLHSLFASIPHQWYVNNKINEYEGFYASMVYALFAATGLEVTCEDTTNKGRIDLTIKHGNKIYLMEFKVIKNENEKGTALRQIKQKRYFEKYQSKGNEIYLIGIEMNEKEKNIVNWETEKIN